jgi:hypothetical protein
VDRYQRTLMPLAPLSPPEAGEREAKPICCPPGGVENPGRSSLLKVRHELTYLVVPVIGTAFAGLLGLAGQPTKRDGGNPPSTPGQSTGASSPMP